MTNRFHKLIIYLVLLLPKFALAENMKLEVIPLQHRMVDDVVHIIRPLITPGGIVTGMNNQLIIKTTSSNLAEIERIFKSIDHAPRKLIITVKQNVGGRLNIREKTLTGKYASDDLLIDAGHDHSSEGLSVSAGDKKSQLRIRTLDNTLHTDDRKTFKVQAIEGRPAFINQGKSVPVNSSTTYVTERGVVVNQSPDYHKVRSGFNVLPRLNGDQVTLITATELSSVQPGHHPASNVQVVETTVTGRLGEWMELGGIDLKAFIRIPDKTLPLPVAVDRKYALY
jgi:type II secretory pathway component GspD/PulD (secretin)